MFQWFHNIFQRPKVKNPIKWLWQRGVTSPFQKACGVFTITHSRTKAKGKQKHLHTWIPAGVVCVCESKRRWCSRVLHLLVKVLKFYSESLFCLQFFFLKIHLLVCAWLIIMFLLQRSIIKQRQSWAAYILDFVVDSVDRLLKDKVLCCQQPWTEEHENRIR